MMAAIRDFRARSHYGTFKRICISLPQAQRATYATSRFEPAQRDNSEDDQVQDVIQRHLVSVADQRKIPIPPQIDLKAPPMRTPLNITALRSQPLRRPATHNIPVATLQLRSYSVRNLEFMADFALRAAYYLGLPAKGPVPLPRITERWTVPKGVFVHKKAQQNWERITMRRMVQIVDGDVDVVKRWLSFIRRWSWYGVGMKANVWEHEGVGVAARMDKDEAAVDKAMEGARWDLLGMRKGLEDTEAVGKYMDEQGFGSIGSATTATAAPTPAPKSKAKGSSEKSPAKTKQKKTAEKTAPQADA